MPTSSLPSIIDREKLLDSARALPAMPISITRLATLVAQTDFDVADVAETITLDQSLTAALLRQANSAALGRGSKIGTVRDAVMRLGTSAVLTIALSGQLSRQMENAIPQYGLEAGELWRHSVLTAIAAELVKSKAGVKLPAETATAALLHDIGKLVLANYMTPNLVRMIEATALQTGLQPIEVEVEVLGLHHGEVGAMIVEHWKLPQSIAQSVQFHHDPKEGGTEICHAVALSDMIAHYAADLVASGADSQVPIMDDLGAEGPALDRLLRAQYALRIPRDVCNELVYATAARFGEVSARFKAE